MNTNQPFQPQCFQRLAPSAIAMAGAIIENMSSRKLAILGGVLLVCQVRCLPGIKDNSVSRAGVVLHGRGDLCTEPKQLGSVSRHLVQGCLISFFPPLMKCEMIAQDPDGLSKGKHKHESWFVPRGKKKCQVCFPADVRRWLNCFLETGDRGHGTRHTDGTSS